MALIFGDGQDELRKMAANATVATLNWHVGSDNWLSNVLLELWPQFTALRGEIESAAKASILEASAAYEKWRAQLTALNPEASEKEIEEAARRRSGMDKSPEERVSSRYIGRVMILYTEVAIMSAALCEAEINLALAWGLSMMDKEDAFRLVEPSSALDKWLHGPKLLLPDYSLPSGSGLVETLGKVIGERNRLVHPKATVQKGGKTKLDGKMMKPTKLSELVMWIARYFSLPFDLAEYLQSQPPIQGSRFPSMASRGDIKRAEQHRLPRPSASV